MKTHIKILLLLALSGLAASCGSNRLPTESLSPLPELSIPTTTYHGITLAALPGDTFMMGDGAGAVDERPVHPVIISPFEISTTEITNAQYAKFLNDKVATGDITYNNDNIAERGHYFSGNVYIYNGNGVANSPEDSCWIRYGMKGFEVKPGKEKWPVVFVTWYGAKAFTDFYGLDLPTEAQWEYASRGRRQLKYGTQDGFLSPGDANLVGSHNSPQKVGGYPPNPFKLYDMVGNVREWCLDWYSSGYYTQSPDQDPPGPEIQSSSDGRLIRGSSYLGDFPSSRSAARAKSAPDYGGPDLGFRVVRN